MKGGAMTSTPQALPQTLMAFDVGLKRTGVAVASRMLGHAQAQPTLHAMGDARWPLIQRQIETWQPDALVVGVPFHPDGAPHDNTHRAQRFARQLHGRQHLTVSIGHITSLSGETLAAGLIRRAGQNSSTRGDIVTVHLGDGIGILNQHGR